jgi:Zn-dependent peptidase ImmA (M78 family)
MDLRAEAERDARKLLANYWDEDLYPVDPFRIASDLGVTVFRGDLPEDLSGMLRVVNGDVELYVDTDDAPRRQRFTAAHELGHFWQRKERGELVEGAAFIDRRGWRATAGTDPDEIYANAFAAALLMPRAIVEHLHAFFDVSPASAEYRIQNLGLV